MHTSLMKSLTPHSKTPTSGATTICTRLKLLGKQERPTKLGLTFAFHHYYRQSVRDALMTKQERAA